MRRHWLTAVLVVALGPFVPLLLTSCGGNDCGSGTTERDGECVAVQVATPECLPGTVANADGDCVPADEVCGAGATLVNGECVVDDDLCTGDQVYVGGECVDPCGEGTVRNDAGDCVPEDNICGQDQIWSGGACVPGCGAGDAYVDGECVPVAEICDDGEIWVGGACVPEIGCGMGTVQETLGDGTIECVPIDPMDAVTVPEAAEPNDPFYGGAPAEFVLPDIDDTEYLGGTIDVPTDLDDDGEADADFDHFAFEGTAGQRLFIEATAVNVPSTAFALMYFDDEGYVTWARFGLPLGSRNAAREVVLPFDGLYLVMVGDAGNLIDWWELDTYCVVSDPYGVAGVFEIDCLPGVEGEWDGASDYTYVTAVTQLTNPTPTVVDSTAIADFEVTGDLRDLDQWLLDLDAGSLVVLDMESHNVDVQGLVWLATSDYAGYFGQWGGVIASVPAGGLLVTTDYILALARDTGFTLTAEVVDVTEFSDFPGTDVTESDESIDPGGVAWYTFTTTDDIVLHAVLSGNDDALVQMTLLDSLVEALVSSDGSFTIALDAGTYYVAVTDDNYDTDPLIEPAFDLDLTSYPLETLGGGVVTHATDLTQSDTLTAQGEQVFYRFEVAAVGDLVITADPGTNLDVAFELYGSPLLSDAADDAGDPIFYLWDLGADEGGADGTEEVEFTSLDAEIFLRAYNAGGEAATENGLDFTVGLTAIDGLIPEIEPNDDPVLADDLGTLTTDATYSYGDLQLSVYDLPDDFWSFSLDSPAEVTLWADPLGLAPTSAEIDIVDPDVNVLDPAPEDFFGYTETYESAAVDLPAGDYLLWVYPIPDWSVPDDAYLLGIQITAEYEDCAPSYSVCGTDTAADDVQVCNATGDGVTETLVTCNDGCADGECIPVDEAGGDAGDSATGAQDLGTLNPDAGTAQTIVDASLEDRGGARDTDWYAFDTDDLSEVEIWLDSSDDIQPDIWLYWNDAGDLREVAYASGFSGIGPSAIAAGDYLVRVEHTVYYGPDDEPLPGTYQLFIDLRAIECVPGGFACSGDDAHDVVACDSDGQPETDPEYTCEDTCVEYALGSGCDYVLDSEELETPSPNDLFGQAQNIGAVEAARVAIEGVIETDDDVDWYEFTVDSAALYTISTVSSLRGWPGFDAAIELYPAADETYLIDSGDSLSQIYLPAANYRLRVAHWNEDGTGDYRVIIYSEPGDCQPSGPVCDGDTLTTCKSDGGGPDEAADDTTCTDTCVTYRYGFESGCDHIEENEAGGNDTYDDPQILGTLAFGRTTLEGDVDTSGDIDWYQITTGAGSGGLLILGAADTLVGEVGFETEITLYEDPGVAALGDSLASDAGTPHASLDPFALEESTSYLIKVEYSSEGSGDDTGDYRLVLDFFESDCGNGILEYGEECDDNETPGDGCTACAIDFGYGCDVTADPSVCFPWPELEIGTTNTITETLAGDESDYYTVTLATPVVLDITVTSGGSPWVAIYTEEGFITYFDDMSATQSVVLLADTYLFEIFADTDPIAGYTVDLATEEVPDLGTFGAEDPITGVSTAVELAAGESDFYVISFTDDVWLTGTVDSKTSGNLDFYIWTNGAERWYYLNQYRWFFNDTETNDGEAFFGTHLAGTYILDVRAYTALDTAPLGYNLTLSTAVPSLTFGTCTVPEVVASDATSYSGTTVGAENNVDNTCSYIPTNESVLSWTSDVTGDVTLSTDNGGTNMDTSLAVRETDCAGTELECNDDINYPFVTTSEVTFSASDGDTYFIVVETSSTSDGDFELSITRP